MGNVDSKADVLTLTDALKSGPGLAGYVYDADTLCVECGREKLEHIYKQFPNGIYWPFACDSDTIPQPIWFGESDYPQYCGNCAVYIYGGVEYKEGLNDYVCDDEQQSYDRCLSHEEYNDLQ